MTAYTREELLRDWSAALDRAVEQELGGAAMNRDDVEALRRDAERYRYLRNRDPAEVMSKEGKDAGCWIDCEEEGGIAYNLQLLTGDDADAAIDAALKEVQR